MLTLGGKTTTNFRKLGIGCGWWSFKYLHESHCNINFTKDWVPFIFRFFFSCFTVSSANSIVPTRFLLVLMLTISYVILIYIWGQLQRFLRQFYSFYDKYWADIYCHWRRLHWSNVGERVWNWNEQSKGSSSVVSHKSSAQTLSLHVHVGRTNRRKPIKIVSCKRIIDFDENWGIQRRSSELWQSNY